MIALSFAADADVYQQTNFVCNAFVVSTFSKVVAIGHSAVLVLSSQIKPTVTSVTDSTTNLRYELIF